MRTKQFKRLESLLMNKPVSENLRPETGLALKKRKNTNQHVKQQRILQKLQKLNILNTYTQSDEIQYSIDQINFELKKNQSRATSEFGYQLQQRKKFRWFYGGLSTRHVQKLLKGAQSDAEIFQTLERRLDISLWRCGFFTSVYAARQWVLHKRVFVNGKVAVRPSHPLKPGDVVTIDQKWQDALKQQIFERFVKFFKNLEDTRKLNQEFPNLRSIFLTQPLNEYALQNADEGRTPNLSELNHDNTSRNYHKQFINSSLYNPISAMKPVHLEISFDIFAFVYLYVPQKMAFPMLIDLAAIRKSF
jgi:ribosomal protein S4